MLLKRDTKAAANMLRAAGLDRADLQAKDARVLASAAQASARRATPARAAGPPAAWCAALASSAARADNTDDADFLLGALVDVARRCSSIDAAVAPHLEALVSNERCWPRAGALLAHLGAVPSEVVRAACATVSADATASIALLDALKARGAVDDAAALLLETTAAALTDAAHATAPGAATASVIFTASAAASSAEPSRAVLARLAAADCGGPAAQPRDVAQRMAPRARGNSGGAASACPSSRRTTRARPWPPRVSGASPPPSAIRRRRRAAASRLTRSRRGLLCERRAVTSCNAPARVGRAGQAAVCVAGAVPFAARRPRGLRFRGGGAARGRRPTVVAGCGEGGGRRTYAARRGWRI